MKSVRLPSTPPPSAASRSRLWMFVPITALLLMVVLIATKHENIRPDDMRLKPISSTKDGTTSVVQRGSIGNVPYYHCDNKNGVSLVLLHGAKYTKEDWLNSGILFDLCQASLQVVALDLSVKATHSDLQHILDQLAARKLIQLPITLVTPSASGFAVVDWIQHAGQAQELDHYVRTWVPVASLSVRTASPEALSALTKTNVQIFAMHGDLDLPGKKSSELLQQYSGARVQELPGGHPFYLDSPKLFVQTILAYIEDRSG